MQEELEKRILIPRRAGRQLRDSLDQLLKYLKQLEAPSKDSSRRKVLDAQLISATRDQIWAMKWTFNFRCITGRAGGCRNKEGVR